MVTIKNPIIPGFSPDPSICVVGEDFYLVNSTFAYFPGVPIYHSRDLCHWEQIGNLLDRPSQLRLEDAGQSKGIFAPTLRYYKGLFYMITTNMSYGGNFIVTAEKPEGPWSEPYFLENAPGIDPTLFFEGDKCYYVGTRGWDSGRYFGDNEIWLQELDLDEMRLTGPVHVLWKGSQQNAVWAEGPHIYKRGEYYYLLIAEGGTGFYHSVTIARSTSLFGEYEGYIGNPILTHRHLGHDYPLQYTGHADLFETADGQWYMVLLASRVCEGHSNLGRETCLAMVQWEDGWPIVNPGEGRVLPKQTIPMARWDVPPKGRCIHFDGPLDNRLLFLRNPQEDMYTLAEERIRLHTLAETLSERKSPAYLGVRQLAFDWIVRTRLTFTPRAEKEEAGLAMVQSDAFHIRLVITKNRRGTELAVIRCKEGKEETLAVTPVASDTAELSIRQSGQLLSFYIKEPKGEGVCVLGGVDARFLSTEAAGGFVGTTTGIYATGGGTATGNFAEFYWLEAGEDR